VAGWWSDISEIQRLREENKSLKRQVGQLQADLIAREQIVVENEHLRQQLDIEKRQPWQLLGAEVLVRSPDAGRRVMTIARGSEDGVRVGMAVVGQNDSQPSALVGIVEDVNPHTANVLLVTDVGSRISAYILYRNTSALGLVQGQWQHGSRLRLEQLDRVARLTPGTVVVSGGMTGELDLNLPLASVPRGIPIGTITTVLEDDGLTQFAELRPFVDPDQVRYVWIILNQEE
jgi:rod shape-determining protein MreC